MPERYGKTAFMTLLGWFHQLYVRTSVRYELFLLESWLYLVLCSCQQTGSVPQKLGRPTFRLSNTSKEKEKQLL
jgi:hypothetical protein